jgi:hypothetical protein
MGHTSGIGNGFAMIAFAAVVVACIIGGVAYGFASLFHHWLANVLAGTVMVGAFAYWFYQPRGVCIATAVCGGIGGALSYWVMAAVAGFWGGVLGVVGGAVATGVLIVIAAIVFSGSIRKGSSESWRKSKKSDGK